MEVEESFMEIRNSMGPRMEPCGTPHVIALISECVSPKPTYCCLLRRYDLNQSMIVPLFS